MWLLGSSTRKRSRAGTQACASHGLQQGQGPLSLSQGDSHCSATHSVSVTPTAGAVGGRAVRIVTHVHTRGCHSKTDLTERCHPDSGCSEGVDCSLPGTCSFKAHVAGLKFNRRCAPRCSHTNAGAAYAVWHGVGVRCHPQGARGHAWRRRTECTRSACARPRPPRGPRGGA